MGTTCSRRETCCEDECLEPVASGGRCEMHRKQASRTPNLSRGSAERDHPRSRLLEASHLVADAPTDDDEAFRLRVRKVERAALNYAKHRGYRKAD